MHRCCQAEVTHWHRNDCEPNTKNIKRYLSFIYIVVMTHILEICKIPVEINSIILLSHYQCGGLRVRVSATERRGVALPTRAGQLWRSSMPSRKRPREGEGQNDDAFRDLTIKQVKAILKKPPSQCSRDGRLYDVVSSFTL